MAASRCASYLLRKTRLLSIRTIARCDGWWLNIVEKYVWNFLRLSETLSLHTFFFWKKIFFGLLSQGHTHSIWRFPGQGLNRSCSCRPTPQPQQHGVWAATATYTTAHSNTGCLTHWVVPGIEPASSWILVGFVNHWATVGTPVSSHFETRKWNVKTEVKCVLILF